MVVKENSLYVEDFYNHIINEGYRLQADEWQKSVALITFSTDVNAVILDKNPLINKAKQFLATMKNRFDYKNIICKAADNLIAYSVGRLNGRYRDEAGNIFDEHSKTLKILGIDKDTAIELADKLCAAFKQESVMLEYTYNGKVDNPVFVYHTDD